MNSVPREFTVVWTGILWGGRRQCRPPGAASRRWL